MQVENFKSIKKLAIPLENLNLFFNELSLEGKESIKIKSALMLVKYKKFLFFFFQATI